MPKSDITLIEYQGINTEEKIRSGNMTSGHDHTMIRGADIKREFKKREILGEGSWFDRGMHHGLIAALCSRNITVYFNSEENLYIAVGERNDGQADWAINIPCDKITRT